MTALGVYLIPDVFFIAVLLYMFIQVLEVVARAEYCQNVAIKNLQSWFRQVENLGYRS